MGIGVHALSHLLEPYPSNFPQLRGPYFHHRQHTLAVLTCSAIRADVPAGTAVGRIGQQVGTYLIAEDLIGIALWITHSCHAGKPGRTGAVAAPAIRGISHQVHTLPVTGIVTCRAGKFEGCYLRFASDIIFRDDCPGFW